MSARISPLDKWSRAWEFGKEEGRKEAAATLEAEVERLEAENERLRAALRLVLADIADYERVNNLSPNPGKQDCWQSVTNARAAMEGKE